MHHQHRLSVLLLSLPLAAQQINLTAHPQETIQNGNANLSPLGCLNTGFGAEARSQILVPADELPGPGALLTGIEVHALSAGTLTYTSLQIIACPTSSTSLSPTFASNLNAGQITVLSATGLTITYPPNAWQPIPVQPFYVHDGVSALVLDFAKIVSFPSSSGPFVTMDTSSSPQRLDRPSMVYSFGGPGSGGSTASSAFAAADPVTVRLQWLGMPTLRNRGDLNAAFVQYGLGGSVVHTVQGTPGSFYLLLIGTGYLNPPLPIPGIAGLLRVNGSVLSLGLLDPAGEAQFTMNIPNRPSLVGLHLTYQAGTIDTATSAPVLTNGMDHFVN